MYKGQGHRLHHRHENNIDILTNLQYRAIYLASYKQWSLKGNYYCRDEKYTKLINFTLITSHEINYSFLSFSRRFFSSSAWHSISLNSCNDIYEFGIVFLRLGKITSNFIVKWQKMIACQPQNCAKNVKLKDFR